MSFLFPVQCKSNSDLIKYLWENGTIKHVKVHEAMLNVDRGDFSRLNPYSDLPQYIGHNSTISPPSMHALALNILYPNLKEGSKVLDIGCGSGYLCAVFAYLVGIKGKVIGIEHIKELANLSKKNLKKNHKNLLKIKNIEIICGDGRNGYLNEAPYDCINVGAAASNNVAMALCKQLKNNGKMVIPVQTNDDKQIFKQYVKDKNGNISIQNMCDVKYVPLTDENKQRESHLFG